MRLRFVEMLRKPSSKPKQKTRPKKGEPVEIPVPSKRDVMRDLEKMARSSQPESRKTDTD